MKGGKFLKRQMRGRHGLELTLGKEVKPSLTLGNDFPGEIPKPRQCHLRKRKVQQPWREMTRLHCPFFFHSPFQNFLMGMFCHFHFLNFQFLPKPIFKSFIITFDVKSQQSLNPNRDITQCGPYYSCG